MSNALASLSLLGFWLNHHALRELTFEAGLTDPCSSFPNWSSSTNSRQISPTPSILLQLTNPKWSMYLILTSILVHFQMIEVHCHHPYHHNPLESQFQWHGLLTHYQHTLHCITNIHDIFIVILAIILNAGDILMNDCACYFLWCFEILNYNLPHIYGKIWG